MGLITVLKLQEMEQKLGPMLQRTGRAGAVSTEADAGARASEQEGFDAARDAKRKAFFSDVYSKGEIAFNKRQMEDGFAAKQKTANTDAWQREVALAKAELDTPGARENIRLAFSMADAVKTAPAKNIGQANKEGKLKDKSAAMDLRVNTAIEAAIQQKAADTVGASYGDKIHAKVLEYATAKLGHAPSQTELEAFSPADMNGFAQAALAELEDNNPDIGRVGLAHYDSRHTKPGEADMLARVGGAVSPDLKQKSAQTGTYNASLTDVGTGATTTVPTPVYAGTNTTATVMPVDAVKNRRREAQTNTVSTVKSPEAGMFLIEDAMAQAWGQATLDPAMQNLAGEDKNLIYEFGGHQGQAMSYDGGLGDTYSVPAGLAGLGQANSSPTPFDKIKTRLDNLRVDRDNDSAKLVIKQDKQRGGYDTYTMMSQVGGPTNTGMRSFTRGAPTGAQPEGAIQLDPTNSNRPFSVTTDWNAAAEKRATKVKAGMTAQKNVANTALATANVRKQSATVTAQVADGDYDAHVNAEFGGTAPAGVLEAVKAGAEAAARLANLAEIKTDAEKLLQDAADKVANADAGVAAARTVLTNAVSAAVVGPAKDAATKKLQEFEARVTEIAKANTTAQAAATAQLKTVQDAITAATADQAAAEKGLNSAVSGAGLKTGDKIVADLIAKAKSKAAAGIELGLATSLAKGAEKFLETATANETQADEDLKTIQAGGLDNFLTQQVTTAKAKAKSDLEGAVASATTPEAKSAALNGMLETAETEALAIQEERGKSRMAKLDKTYALEFAAYGKQEAAQDEFDEATGVVATLEKSGKTGGEHDAALAIAKTAQALKKQALEAAEREAAAVAAFEQAMRDAEWNLVLRDEAEDARAKSEALELAASVGTASGAAAPPLNAARKSLADALKVLHSSANATAEAGDDQREAAVQIKAATRDEVQATKRVQSLAEAAAALGVPTPALAKKMTEASDWLAKVKVSLASAETAFSVAKAAYKTNETQMNAAREAVEKAEEVLDGLQPAK